MKTILQQKLVKKLFLVVLTFSSFLSFSQKDDYPWKNETYNTPNLIFGMYYKHCTDWVAWKINQNQDDKATTAPHAFWNSMYSSIGTTSDCTPTSAKQRLSNACRWENVLENNGFFVTSTPTPGAIAQWNSNENGVSAEGHVGYVESVNIGEIPVLSHYNFDKNIRGIYKLTTNVSAPRYIRYNVFELANTPNIQAIIQGNPFSMTATIKSNHSASVTVKIRAALYSVSNQFLGVLEEKTITFTAGQSKSLTFYKSNIESTAGNYKVWIETRVNDATPFTLVHKFQASSTQSIVINGASANCKITLSRNITIGGGVSGDGTFVCGSSKSVTATPNSGYSFVNWTENGNSVSTDATYNFTLSKDRNLVANFVKSTTINIIGNINAVVYPTSVGNNRLSCNTEKNVSFTIKNISNATVVRSFKLYITDMNGNEVGELWNANNLSLLPNETKTYNRTTNTTLGSLVESAAGLYKLVLKGDTGTLDNITLNSPSVVCQNGSCNPQNIEIECPCTLYINVNPSAGGTVNGFGTFTCGISRTVTATANSGYNFSNWTENGNVVSTNASYTFTLSTNRNLVANFSQNQTATCISCPSHDFSPSVNSSWGNHSSSILSNGCKIYRFLAVPGNTYIFKTGCEDGASTSFDSVLDLFDTNCAIVSSNDEYCPPTSKIEWICNYTSTNWVYLKVKGFQAAFGNYTLAYTALPTLSINNPDTLIDGLTLYPNPTKDTINITTNQIEINKISIINTLGLIIKTVKVNKSEYKLNIQDLPTSSYLLKIETEKGTQTVKIIKE